MLSDALEALSWLEQEFERLQNLFQVTGWMEHREGINSQKEDNR